MRPTPNRYPQEGSRWIDLLLLAPLALITAALGFWLSSTLAAWVVPSALALTGIGVAAAVGLPAVLSLGHRLRFFLKAVIVSNAVALFGAILLIPGGVQQAVRKNGAWAAKAVAPYLPAPQKAALPEAAARLSEILAERLPDGPGALSYLFPEPEEAPPKVKVAPSKGAGEAAVVKFKKNGASIIVKAELNGAATVPMIYDTGASLTTIDGDTARRLGISLTARRASRSSRCRRSRSAARGSRARSRSRSARPARSRARWGSWG
jgi:hypothetical protein